MADSRFEGEWEGQQFRELPMIQEGEPVLTFRGPKMRRGECVLSDSEDMKVRYLVRYQREGFSPPRGERVIPVAAPLRESEAEVAPEAEEEAKMEHGDEGEAESEVEVEANPHGLEAGPSDSRSPSPKRSRRSPRPSPSQHLSSSSSSSSSGLMGDEDLMIPSKDDDTSSRSSPRSAHSSALPLGQQHSNPRMELSKEQLYSIVVIGGWEYEWVPESRLLRYSAIHMQLDSDTALQMAAKREQREDCPVTSSEGSPCGAVAEHPPPQKKGRRRRSRGRGRSRFQRRKFRRGRRAAGDFQQEFQVYLPKVLKPLLVQDWELVTLGKKLFTLPARKTVDAILTEYASFHENSGTAAKKLAVNELMAMIKEYFDLVLGTQLLYNFERPQYAEILISQPTAQMSQVYGGAHLLRLFPQLSSMLSCTSLGKRSLNVLLTHLQDFLEYLANDPSLLCIDPIDYQLATKEYQQTAG
ncbi:mortality factor 4-like protein 1 [Sarcophilus harrisii]|uniref:mortality factor 4-like protein 1 n=1 Tax=Sarcophilus harrisii TaxID=9305 RepID=UPI001301AC68|nr:mortality factor 4-like protein 1 [Sarcophilus harrisii]